MDRFWGVEKDKVAARQLGVSDDYTIFVMANEMDYIDDVRRIMFDAENDLGSCYPSEIVERIEQATKRVMLPGKLQMVGMMPTEGAEGEEVYGVVDFSTIV